MGQFKDAIDKQFPPKTDDERAAHYAARLQRDRAAPFRVVYLFFALISAIPFVYSVSASAFPMAAPMAAAAVAARNNQSNPEPDVWKDGPCKGKVRASCTWFLNGVEQK